MRFTNPASVFIRRLSQIKRKNLRESADTRHRYNPVRWGIAGFSNRFRQGICLNRWMAKMENVFGLALHRICRENRNG
jgi:hypothetical protein